MDRLLNDLITIWVVIDPIGTLPVFLAVTGGMDVKAARGIAVRAVLLAFAVLMFFVVAGQFLLQAMGISLASFQLAGSIVLFVFALTMIFGESKPDEEMRLVATSDVERAVYPLAIPSIAGPGAMLAVVVLTDNERFGLIEQAETAAEIGIVLAVTLVLLLLAGRIVGFIGKAGASVISRVMGLVLASVAVDGAIKALAEITRTWPA